MDTDLAVDTHTGASTRYINTASASRPRPARRAAPNQPIARRRHAARARRRTELSHNSSRSGSARPATRKRRPGHTSHPMTYARSGATRRRNSRCGNQSVRLAGLEVSFIFWPPRRSARVLGVLARGLLGLLTQIFYFRTGNSPSAFAGRGKTARPVVIMLLIASICPCGKQRSPRRHRRDVCSSQVRFRGLGPGLQLDGPG